MNKRLVCLTLSILMLLTCLLTGCNKEKTEEECEEVEKSAMDMVGTVAMMPDTGEIIEGIDVVEVPAAFSVKFSSSGFHF